MQLKLSCYCLKINYYNYTIFYVSLMSITKIPIEDTFKKMRKDKAYHQKKKISETHRKTGKEKKEEEKSYKTDKTLNKMAISPSQLIITLNLNE